MENTLSKMDLEFCGTRKHKIFLEKLFETENVFFLDVRDSKEVQTLAIPVNELSDRLGKLPDNKIITYFCPSGTRSGWAYIYLLSKGYNAKWLAASNEDLAKMLKPGKVFKAVK